MTTYQKFCILDFVERTWSLSSAGRASALQAGGHRFEPCSDHHVFYGPVVQLVRTLACHARGRRFEPVPGRHFLWLHSSVGRAEDWKSSCQWFDSTWSHQKVVFDTILLFLLYFPYKNIYSFFYHFFFVKVSSSHKIPF